MGGTWYLLAMHKFKTWRKKQTTTTTKGIKSNMPIRFLFSKAWSDSPFLYCVWQVASDFEGCSERCLDWNSHPNSALVLCVWRIFDLKPWVVRVYNLDPCVGCITKLSWGSIHLVSSFMPIALESDPPFHPRIASCKLHQRQIVLVTASDLFCATDWLQGCADGRLSYYGNELWDQTQPAESMWWCFKIYRRWCFIFYTDHFSPLRHAYVLI